MKFSHRNTLTKATQRPGWEDTNVNLHFLSKFAKTRNLFHKSLFFIFQLFRLHNRQHWLVSMEQKDISPASPECDNSNSDLTGARVSGGLETMAA